jgi:pyruvate dehydrogenase E1 component alpha subunit
MPEKRRTRKEDVLRTGKHKISGLRGESPELLLDLYRFMLELRMVQEALIKEYHPANEMRCPVHFCVGEEAAPAALSKVLRKDDWLFCDHRGHGFYLAKGGDLNALFAELYGKAGGCNGGIAGSQEICMPSVRFYSGAILSGMGAVACGAAFESVFNGRDNLSVAVIGDGAADEGNTWETINYAALKKLPVLFICENNGYSTYSPQSKRQPLDNISERVAAFGVESVSLFGNDTVELLGVLREAAEYCRSGKGPFFVETYTCRWNSHVGPADDAGVGYRTKEEIEFWRANCPAALLEESLAASNILSPGMREALARKITLRIEEAFKFAKSSPFPSPPDWETVNLFPGSPAADRLLPDTEAGGFDFHQDETVPKSY